MPKAKDRLVRTSITIPASLKQRMDRTDENWSEFIREVLVQRLEEEGEEDMTEALMLNERIKRPAPKNWNSLRVIKEWRRRTST